MSAVSDGDAKQGTRDAAELAAQSRLTLTVPRRLLRLRSDTALAERYAAGDEGAFNVLYERHRGAVLAVCMGVLGTPHDAEDATQETFSSLTATLRGAGQPPREVRAWLLRVARNASIDTIRRRRHRLLTLDGEIPDIQARQPTGASELETVMEGVRELPENQRLALMMRELGGHSYKDIAQLLDTDEDGVRGLIARARVALRSYREAIEMPCADARAAIAAEPDGRRREKTVRHHLKHCEACRHYLGALRDDARLLRAAIPGQAATGIAGAGTNGGGAVAAAKGLLLGAGMTQAATACAASVCAVGAVGVGVGGIVLLAPPHHVTSETLTPAATTETKPHRHVAAAVTHHKAATATAAVTPAPVTAPPSSTVTAPSAAATVSHGGAAAPVEHKHVTRRLGHGDGQRANAVDGTYPFSAGSSQGGGRTVGKPTFSEAPKSSAVVTTTTTPATAAPPTDPTPVTATVPAATSASGTGDPSIPSTDTTVSTVVGTGAAAPADTGSSAADSAGSSGAADPSSSGSTPTGASDPSGATGSGSGGTTSGAAAAGGTVSGAPSSGGAGRGGSAATGTSTDPTGAGTSTTGTSTDPTAVTSTSPVTSPTSTTAAVTATTAGTDTTASAPTSTDVTPAPTTASAPAWYGPSSPRWQRYR